MLVIHESIGSNDEIRMGLQKFQNNKEKGIRLQLRHG